MTFGVPVPDSKCPYERAKGEHLYLAWVSVNFGPLVTCHGCGKLKE